MSTITVKVNTQNETVAEHKVVTNQGTPTTIKAVDKINYELLDEATGRAPNHIVTKRIDKDLHISFENDSLDPDLIIEGFYDDIDSALIGVAEDGSYYYYVPDTGEVADYVTELQIGDIQGQALGGNAQATPWWVGAAEAESFDALPWLVGLAGVGLIGAALGSSDNDNNNNDNRPSIDITAPDAPTDLVISEDGSKVTGKGEPGANVEITDPNGTTIGEGIVNENGEFEVDLVPPQVDGEEIEATLIDNAGNTSDSTNIVAPDLTAPDAPTAEINPEGTLITGTTEPDAIVSVDTNGDGDPDYTVTADEDGNYEVDTSDMPLVDGETITVTATDIAGNKSEPTDILAEDTAAPDAPTDITVGNGDGFLSAAEIDIDGNVDVVIGLPDNAVAGDTLIVNGEEQVITAADITANQVTVKVPAPAEGDTLDITASIKDAAGNESAALTETIGVVDTAAPDNTSTTITIDSLTDDNIINSQEAAAQVTITGQVAGDFTIGDAVTVTVNGIKSTGIVGANGLFSVEVAGSDLAADTNVRVSIEATDAAGNTGTVTQDKAYTVDTAAPDAPIASFIVTDNVANDGSGDILDIPEIIQAGEVTNDNTPSITIPAGTLGVDEIAQLVVDGKVVEATIVENADGTITLTPNTALAEGTHDISYNLKDSAGNESGNGPVVNITVDTTAPGGQDGATQVAPVIAIPEAEEGINADEIADGIQTQITLPTGTLAGDSINLTVTPTGGGTPIEVTHTVTATEATSGISDITIPNDPNSIIEDGSYSIVATVTDKAGNSSAPSTALDITIDTVAVLTVDKPIAGDNVVNADEALDGFNVTGTGTAGDTITLTYGINGELGTAVVGANGKWSITVTEQNIANMNQGLETLTITAKDPAGNVSSETADITIVPATALTITSPIAGDNIVNADEAVNGFNVTGTGAVGDTITLTNQAGDIIGTAVVGVNNKWSIAIDSAQVAAMGEGAEILTAISTVGSDVTKATINIDTIAPNDTTTEIIIDDVTGDNVINAIEAEGNIAVTGTVSGDYREGDALTMTVNGVIYSGVVDLAGNFSIEVPGAALVADADKRIEVSITATDKAGNTSIVNTTKDYVVNTTEIIAAADNFVDLQLVANPLEIPNEKPSDLNKTGFTVVGASLGPVLGAGVVADVIKNSVVLEVGENQVREVTVKGNAGGVQVVGTMDLSLYKLNESTNEWELQEVKENWVVSYLLGGVSKDTDFSLDEGQWLFVMSGGEGVSALTGYTLQFEKDVVLDYSQATEVSGSVTGNILDDEDSSFSYDELPSGTTVISITSVNGVEELETGSNTIQGQYGTLTISPDGTYDYKVNDDFRGPYGSEESFTYTIASPDGNTASADLTIQLNILPADKQIKIDESLVVDIEPTVTLDTADSDIKDAVGFGVLDLSLGSSSVLDLELLGGKPPLEFTVGDNQVRELTLHGSGGGVDIAKTYSMAVYKLDESTGQYVQVHFEKNWFNVPLLGGRSDPLTLKFGEGDYKAVLLTAGGVGVLSGNGLYVDYDKIYDYNSPSSFMGQIAGDATPDASTVILKVGETLVTSGSSMTYQGKYGQLTIDANGEYTYSVNNNASDPNWQPPYGEVDSFRLVTKDANGKAAVETLNIKISTHTAVDDFNKVAVQTQNTVTNISINEPDKIGDYGKSYSKEFEIAEHDAAAPIVIEATASSLNILGGSNITITYTLLNTTTGESFTGSVEGTKASASLSASLPDLPAGNYELTITTNKGNLQSISFDTTVIHSADYTADDVIAVTGSLIAGNDNDQGLSNITEIKVGSKSVFISDPNQGAKSIDIEGLYGTLTVSKDGSYSYLPNGESFGIESFTYQTTSVTGVKETASLEINVGKNITASIYDDIAVGSAADDSFTMGTGADTLIFNNLNGTEGGNGNNGVDIWTDFSEAQGDKIDLTGLLDGNQTSGNIGDYLAYENGVLMVDRNGNTEYEALLQVTATDLNELLSSIDWQVGVTGRAIGEDGIETANNNADVSFMSFNEDTDVFNLTGSEQTISFSDIFETEMIDISGTGANTLNIREEDIVNAKVSNPIYVKGDSDDTVDLQGSDWANTGQTVTDNAGQTYNVWQIENNLSSQVYIDTEIANVI